MFSPWYTNLKMISTGKDRDAKQTAVKEIQITIEGLLYSFTIFFRKMLPMRAPIPLKIISIQACLIWMAPAIPKSAVADELESNIIVEVRPEIVCGWTPRTRRYTPSSTPPPIPTSPAKTPTTNE